MGGWERFNSITTWMIRLAYLNILWLLFTIAGLLLFGLFPATGAMFSVVRNWFIDKHDVSIWTAFWTFYRRNFIKLNGFSLLFFGFVFFLYYDFSFIQLNPGKVDFLFPILMLITLIFTLTSVYFFPTYVHFELKYFQYIKQSFLIAVVSPLETISIILSIAALYFIVTLLPGIIPLFTGSVLASIITWLSFRAFERIKQKQHAR